MMSALVINPEDTAAAHAALSNCRQSTNVIVRSLPEYGVFPAAAVESLNTIAKFIHDEYEGDGPLHLSFNSTMRLWQEMGKKAIFLRPAMPLPAGEVMSMKFLDNTTVQLWQLRGKPTSTTLFAMLVGLARQRNQPL